MVLTVVSIVGCVFSLLIFKVFCFLVSCGAVFFQVIDIGSINALSIVVSVGI